MGQVKPSVRDVAEQRHVDRGCRQSHHDDRGWQITCVRAVDAEVLRIARDESWWHRGEPAPADWRPRS